MRAGLLVALCLAALPACRAFAGEDMEVLSVFAPGNGSNYVAEGEMPPGTASQVEMYDALPDGLASLDRAALRRYFKPALHDIDPGEMATVTRLRPGVRIVRDRDHNIPHVYGDTRADAMFGVGYVRAEDRLWQMESFRAVWRAESAVLAGRGPGDANIRADAATFRLIDYSEAEYRAMFDRLSSDYGFWGRQAASDLREYIDGINAYIAEIDRNPSLLPLEYAARGLAPRPWKVTDAMAMAAYSHVSWGSAGPGEESNAEVLQVLRARLGDEADSIFADLRNAPGPRTPYSLPPVRHHAAGVDPASVALPDRGSFVPRRVATIDDGPLALAATGMTPRKARSNALLVAAAHSATGRPIAVQGPQDGYGTPHLFDSEIVVVAPDFRARGILEISGPYPYVAATAGDYAWSITILPPDQADTFVEVLCEPDGSDPAVGSMHYRYRGQCIPFAIRADERSLPDGGSYTLTSVRSVHGPVIGRATVDGLPVALAQARTMYLHEEMDYPAHARLFSPSAIRSARDFIEAVAGTAYNIGWWYIDDEDIAGVDAGLVPVRKPGAATDLPVWGTGNWDWVGFDPASYTFRTPSKSRYPQAINGQDGVIAGWNNPAAAGWPLKDENWNYSEGNRVQLLKEPTLDLAADGKVDITDLVRIHGRAAISDYHAQRVYPAIRRITGDTGDELVASLLADADAWIEDGGFLRDADGDGLLEHGAAIAFLDEFWNLLARNAFEPLLGEELLAGAGSDNNLPGLRVTPDDANPWIMKIHDGIEVYLYSRKSGYSRNYCGETASECQSFVAGALFEASRTVAARLGDSPGDWNVPATCASGCRQIEFEPTGDSPPVPPISWQNRPTYVQITTGL